ncbi:muscarinic acetylcholine receptor M1-like [Mya arenaria]|uniref:muscarinic acetylcholine receptor M1-like n=1 Tax=Mya arenaria TaxID=6604 RepID=UPI0022E893E8|nr:muscarinic acetylcholine receptor M1-like [Mya arenaria]
MIILLNVLVILAFKRYAHLRKVNNYFILSLAITDLIVGFISVPCYGIYCILGYWPFGSLICDIFLLLDYGICYASVANLLVISFDRFYSISSPMAYRLRRTPCNAIVMIMLAWIIPFSVWAPAIFAGRFAEGKRMIPNGICYVPLFSNTVFTVCAMFLTIYIPIAAMLVLYNKIYKVIKSRKHRNTLSDKKAAKMLCVILIMFIVTLFPFSVFTIVFSVCGECIHPTLNASGYWLFYMSSAANPVCYATCNSNFRGAFLQILKVKESRDISNQHRAALWTI